MCLQFPSQGLGEQNSALTVTLKCSECNARTNVGRMALHNPDRALRLVVPHNVRRRQQIVVGRARHMEGLPHQASLNAQESKQSDIGSEYTSYV
jgi:hypothetical protein